MLKITFEAPRDRNGERGCLRRELWLFFRKKNKKPPMVGGGGGLE